MAQLPDDLVASDLTQAIVLAGVRHEEVVSQFDEGPKRRSRWSECKVAKKGKRWGLPDDKPYKPLCYVDLPMGLTQKEIDQFLREQRLEDLHRKIQAHDLEDFDPDIRPPSPPPVYDKSGSRLNTRDIRIRKAMTAEYNRLIRYMIKHVEGYLPPVDWKPAKLMKKIIIPIEKFPQAPFMGVIIGPRGVNHKRLQETTGCKIFIRGRDIGDKWQSDEEAAMPQHVHIEGDTEEQILTAERLIEPLLNPESPEFEYARTHGMQQLAMVNGFTLNKAEQRCGICGALGHLGFECPETNNQNYKMANVVCTLCGDKGHVASDCKKAAEMNKRENMDWKVMAEKKAQMDKDYSDMMSDLGNQNKNQVTTLESVKPKVPGGPLVPGVVGAAAGGMGSAVDKSIVCPAPLVSKLIGPAGATIKKLATDSGAQINLDSIAQPGGGKAVVITAADPVARERAKMHVNMWIKENQGPLGMKPPTFNAPNMGPSILGSQAAVRPQQAMGMLPQQQMQSTGGLRPVAPVGAGNLTTQRPALGGFPTAGSFGGPGQGTFGQSGTGQANFGGSGSFPNAGIRPGIPASGMGDAGLGMAGIAGLGAMGGMGRGIGSQGAGLGNTAAAGFGAGAMGGGAGGLNTGSNTDMLGNAGLRPPGSYGVPGGMRPPHIGGMGLGMDNMGNNFGNMGFAAAGGKPQGGGFPNPMGSATLGFPQQQQLQQQAMPNFGNTSNVAGGAMQFPNALQQFQRRQGSMPNLPADAPPPLPQDAAPPLPPG